MSGLPTSASACVAVTAQPRRAIFSWASPTFTLAGTAMSIIFGLASFRLFMRSTYSSTDFTCRRGLKAFSSPIVERQPLDRQPVAIRKTHRDDIGLGLLAHHRDAMRMVTKRTEPGDMVSVQMRVDGFYELEIEFVNEMQIPVDLLQDRIDDQRLSARTAREQIGIGAGRLIEKLTENHSKS